MKADERHRLQQNDLGLWMARAGDYWKLYGAYALLALLVVLLVTALSVYLARRQDHAATVGWEALRAATNAEQYANVADEFPGTAVAAWARLNEANWLLRSGIRLAFDERAGAYQDLTKARASYEQALQSQAATPEIREQALFGLAQTVETLAGIRNPEKPDAGTVTSVDDALKAYKALLEQFPETMYKPMVDERIESLKKPSAKDFYAWFADQNPRPADRAMPRDAIHQGLTPPTSPFLPPLSNEPTIRPGAEGGLPLPLMPPGTKLPPSGAPDVPFADPRRFPGPLQDEEPVKAPLPPAAAGY